MLEQRVAALEADMKEVKASLKSIEVTVAEIKGLLKATDLAALVKDVAEVKGKVSMVPTSLQLFTAVIATWAAGATLVFLFVRYMQ